MAFDSFVGAAVVAQLEPLLPAKIVKVHQPDRHNIVLRCYGVEGNFRLLLSAHPQKGRIQTITGSGGENPVQPPLFCMVLRKYLEGGRLIRIRQKELERIFELEFATRNDLGDAIVCRIMVEIMGKHSNIILLSSDNIIIDGIRRYTHQISRYREVLPGQPYLAPPPQTRQLLKGWDEEQLAELIWQLDLDLSLDQALLKNAAGLSPLLAKEVCARANIAPNIVLNQLGQYEISRLNQALDSIYSNDFQPVIHYCGELPQDFAAFPLSLWHGTEKCFPNPSEMMECFYEQRDAAERFANIKRELLKKISAHYQRLVKKIKLQQRDLDKSEAGDAYKDAGDLLSANLYRLKKGLDYIILESFYEPGQTVEIALKPELTPQDNIKRYYRLYNKAKGAYKQILEQLTANQEEEQYLGSILAAAEQTTSLRELQEITNELTSGGYLKEDKRAGRIKEAPLPPRQYRSSDGFTILVGRNNKQNDKLTLKMAAKDDLWLHTQKIHGSHVIIKTAGRQVPEQTLKEAAQLAAWFSKARESSKVPVDYTTADQVKKPHGAKPGMVIYFQQRTLYVDPREITEPAQ